MPRPQTRSFPPPGHNHALCAARALHHAEDVCGARKLRFTAMRRRVLAAIWKSHTPVGA